MGLIERISMQETLKEVREQRKKQEEYKNYIPKLTDDEFKKEWDKACKKVKEGLNNVK